MISYAPLFQTMKNRGISTYRLGKLGFPMSTYYAMRRGDNISTHTLNQLCKLLQCKVEDILEYVDEDPEQLCFFVGTSNTTGTVPSRSAQIFASKFCLRVAYGQP